jgi:hypothetical protein
MAAAAPPAPRPRTQPSTARSRCGTSPRPRLATPATASGASPRTRNHRDTFLASVGQAFLPVSPPALPRLHETEREREGAMARRKPRRRGFSHREHRGRHGAGANCLYRSMGVPPMSVVSQTNSIQCCGAGRSHQPLKRSPFQSTIMGGTPMLRPMHSHLCVFPSVLSVSSVARSS